MSCMEKGYQGLPPLPDKFLLRVFDRIHCKIGDLRDLLPLRLVCKTWNSLLVSKEEGRFGLLGILKDAKLSHGLLRLNMMKLSAPPPRFSWLSNCHCFWQDLLFYDGYGKLYCVPASSLTRLKEKHDIEEIALPEGSNLRKIRALMAWEEEQVLCVVGEDTIHCLDLSEYEKSRQAVWLPWGEEGFGHTSYTSEPTFLTSRQPRLLYVGRDGKTVLQGEVVRTLEGDNKKCYVKESTFAHNSEDNYTIERMALWKERGWIALLETTPLEEGGKKRVTLLDAETGQKKVTVALPLPESSHKILSHLMFSDDKDLARLSFCTVEERRITSTPPSHHATTTHHTTTHELREQHARYLYRFGLWKDDALTLYPLREPLHIDTNHPDREYNLEHPSTLGSILVALVKEVVVEHGKETKGQPVQVMFFNRKGQVVGHSTLEGLSATSETKVWLWKMPLQHAHVHKGEEEGELVGSWVVVAGDTTSHSHGSMYILNAFATTQAPHHKRSWFSWW